MKDGLVYELGIVTPAPKIPDSALNKAILDKLITTSNKKIKTPPIIDI